MCMKSFFKEREQFVQLLGFKNAKILQEACSVIQDTNNNETFLVYAEEVDQVS